MFIKVFMYKCVYANIENVLFQNHLRNTNYF